MASNGIQTKAFKADLIDYENGTVEGYAATFGNADKVHDVVLPGAFKSALLHGPERVRFLWEHDRKEVIGGILEMREDSKGLWIKAKFGSSQRAQETRANMKDGFIDSFSIGYRVLQEKRGHLDLPDGKKKSVNFLQDIQLIEVSTVAWPCNVEARMVAIKSEVSDRFDNLNLEEQSLVEKFIDFLEGEKQDTTEYLLSSDENVEALAKSIEQGDAGEVVEAELDLSDEHSKDALEGVNDEEEHLKSIVAALELHQLQMTLKSLR